MDVYKFHVFGLHGMINILYKYCAILEIICYFYQYVIKNCAILEIICYFYQYIL